MEKIFRRNCNFVRRVLLHASILVACSSTAHSQQLIKVSQSAWLALTSEDRNLIQKINTVELAEQDTFGVIIDNQGVNESTSGTSGGANLGGAVANAAYIDNAFKSGNYSAKNQLAAGILGALLGSALDAKPNAQFRFRYAVKLANGNVQYFDEVKSDPFRHPVGVCVSVPNVALIDQQLCTQTAASLRTKYLNAHAAQPANSAPVPTSALNESGPQRGAYSSDGPSEFVNCKLGNLAPVRTSAEKCELIQGSQVK